MNLFKGKDLDDFSGGFVLSPHVIHVLCLYPGDGHTDNAAKRCSSQGVEHADTCVPGCGDPPVWCEDYQHVDNPWECSWRRWQLARMIHEQNRQWNRIRNIEPDERLWWMESFHNEVVIDARAGQLPMPESIEAVFVQAQSPPEDQQWTREVHARFLLHFHLSRAEVPLVEYNPAHRPPFREIY